MLAIRAHFFIHDVRTHKQKKSKNKEKTNVVSMDAENGRAKHDFINAFHNDAKKRIKFLQQLFSDGYQDEAMTLCLSYIDSFSQWLEWPSGKAGQNFVKAVINFGKDSFMSLVHPLQAVRTFDRMKPCWKVIATLISNVFAGLSYELLEESDFLSRLSPHLSEGELQKVKGELWRTTIAGIAYFGMRNFAIHKFAAIPLTFSNTTYQGHPVSGLDFHRLHKVASNLHSELRHRSETNGQWFGNDEIIDSLDR